MLIKRKSVKNVIRQKSAEWRCLQKTHIYHTHFNQTIDKKAKKKQYYFSFCFLFFLLDLWSLCDLQLTTVGWGQYTKKRVLTLVEYLYKRYNFCDFTLEIKSTNPAYNPDLSFYSLDVFYIVPSPLLPAILSFQPSRKFDTNLLPFKCFPVDRGELCVSIFPLLIYSNCFYVFCIFWSLNHSIEFLDIINSITVHSDKCCFLLTCVIA